MAELATCTSGALPIQKVAAQAYIPIAGLSASSTGASASYFIGTGREVAILQVMGFFVTRAVDEPAVTAPAY